MAPQTKTRRATPARRTSSAPQGRFARNAAASRTQGLRRRRQPQQSGVQKVLGSVLPAAGKKAAPSSKKGKAGGFALVAAAAGMAFKNRGKLSQMRNKDTDTGTTPASSPVADGTIPPGA